ncbi:hypothetical protein FACS1894151_06740 [Spirochaetia bacterium]|nr:hypothetical protein FACS1894151_06740 [Spirochaetia bacterium]
MENIIGDKELACHYICKFSLKVPLAVLDTESLKWAQTATEWSGRNKEMETKIRALLEK